MTTFVNVLGQSSTPVQIKEEEDEDTNKQPAAKRKRGQSKSQTKCEEMPKEEKKSEGNLDLLFTSFVKHVTNVRWDNKRNRSSTLHSLLVCRCANCNVLFYLSLMLYLNKTLYLHVKKRW